jgi:hypothetical protein
MNLHESTKKALARAINNGVGLKDIVRKAAVAAKSREDVIEYEWLRKFSRGEIHNPGIRNIQKLNDVLAGL